jgi:hypothetical protein
MSTTAHDRTLTVHMADWQPYRVARLLQRRPDLVAPKPPANLAELARRAQHYPSVRLAIDRTNLPENRMLQLIVCCRRNVGLDELEAALPEGVSLADIEPVVASLEEAALVWRHDGRLFSSGVLRQAMPTTLGPPVADLANHQTVDYLKAAVAKIRVGVVGSPVASSLPASPGARKAQLVDYLEELLAVPGLVDALLRKAPAEARALAESMASGRPAIPADHFLLSYSPYTRNSYYTSQPSYWLYERGLLLPARDGSAAFQPRAVGVALRGGRPVDDLALVPPLLATGSIDQAAVDRVAAERGVAVLDAVAEMLGRWGAEPAKQLKSGGLGVAVVKRVAAQLDTTLEEAGRIVELAHLAGLLDDVVETRQERRKYIRESWVRPSGVAAGWLRQPAASRWRQIAAAWLRADHWPSASGRKLTDNAKAAPVLSIQRAVDAPARRRDVLGGLAGLDDKGAGDALPATSAGALADWVYWQQPQPWLGNVGGDRVTAISWAYEEAQLLGMAAAGRLSSFGRALLSGHDDEAEQLFAAHTPSEATSFTLQADMTAVVVGRLDRDVLGELRLLADIESTGAATTFRFSEASLRRAIDAGRDGESILAFLRKYAGKGVPQALEYLVTDVARRHGHLLVGTASSFVTSDDPAVLADACAHRRTRKLRLQLLAPTVAVSPEPAAKVMTTLQDAGFLPASDESGQAEPVSNVVVLGAVPGADTGEPALAIELPEPFRQRHRPGVAAAPQLEPDEAASHAEAICAGASPEPSEADGDERDAALAQVIHVEPVARSRQRGRQATFGFEPDLEDVLDIDPFDPDLFDPDLGDLVEESLTLESFRAIVWQAADSGGVLAVVPEDAFGDEPILLGVTGLQGDDAVAGVDLATGRGIVLDYADIAGILEVGDVASLAFASRRGGNRGRRSRNRGRGQR